jgi:hypothetical protein
VTKPKPQTIVHKHIALLEELIREVKGLRRDVKRLEENGNDPATPAVNLETD